MISRWMMMGVFAALVCVLALGASCERKQPPVTEPEETGEETAEETAEETGVPEVEVTIETPKVEVTIETPKVTAGKEPGLPVLFDFETDESVAAWKVEDEIKDQVELSVSTDQATTGKRSLKMVLKEGDWPGMYTFKLPKDWSGYMELKFDVIAEEDADLCVRIDDEDSADYASRFNTAGLIVNKGKNTVTLLLDDVADAIDLKRVKSLFIFSSDVPAELTFYIDNVRLVPKAE